MTADTKAARELLAFYIEAGADGLVDEAPADHFAPAPVEQPVAPPPADRPPSTIRRTLPPKITATTPAAQAAPAPPPQDAAVMSAREAARRATSLDELRAIMNDFQGCALRTTAKQLVFADGDPDARLMFVGEAPGADEDRLGLPFIGRSGKLLDLMIKAIGLDRAAVRIANIVPWRPPGNRDPSTQETQICLPFILRQIELVDPDLVVCLGKPSAQTLLGFTDGIKKTRGRWVAYNTGTREIRAMATLHPAYLLRSPLEKRFAWRDFLSIQEALTKPAP